MVVALLCSEMPDRFPFCMRGSFRVQRNITFGAFFPLDYDGTLNSSAAAGKRGRFLPFL